MYTAQLATIRKNVKESQVSALIDSARSYGLDAGIGESFRYLFSTRRMVTLTGPIASVAAFSAPSTGPMAKSRV